MTAIEFFPGLANDTRLRCLVLMSRHAELCVCELTHALGASQPHIWRHLAQLRELAIVTDRREGLWVYYTINPALPSWARGVLEQTASGTADSSPFAEDEAALAAMANRPGAARCAVGKPPVHRTQQDTPSPAYRASANRPPSSPRVRAQRHAPRDPFHP